MKASLAVGFCFAALAACMAEQHLADYDWSKLAKAGQLLGGTPVSLDGKDALKVVNTNDTPLQIQLVKLVKPPITKKLYAIVGEVKYEGVRGNGYLEMWNVFPPPKAGMVEAAYFSRTLGESGDMGKIAGTSNWRRFMLPFDRTGTSDVPTRLELNLYLPAQGTVYLSPIKLVEYTGNFRSAQAGSAEAWWPDWAGGLIGGIGGALLGLMGGLLAFLSAKGKAREFVLVSTKFLIGLGVLSTGAGFVALGLHQPYEVWFVLLLGGVILLIILPFRLRDYQRRYELLELRKMAAMDA
jgi:hypothetical protein